MKHMQTTGLLLALALSATTGAALAQGTEPAATGLPTREQVRMETKDFLRTHRWDERTDTWMLKSGVEPPTGVTSRAVVKAQRDEFLRLNRWDDSSSGWIPRKPEAPRKSPLSREQVRAETAAFMRTHRWDEQSEAWVALRTARTK